MSDADTVHGEPADAGSETGEAHARGQVKARFTLQCEFDLTDIGGPIIPFTPTPRLAMEVVRAIAGSEATRNIPKQPNQARTFLPPPNSGSKDSGAGGGQKE